MLFNITCESTSAYLSLNLIMNFLHAVKVKQHHLLVLFQVIKHCFFINLLCGKYRTFHAIASYTLLNERKIAMNDYIVHK